MLGPRDDGALLHEGGQAAAQAGVRVGKVREGRQVEDKRLARRGVRLDGVVQKRGADAAKRLREDAWKLIQQAKPGQRA